MLPGLSVQSSMGCLGFSDTHLCALQYDCMAVFPEHVRIHIRPHPLTLLSIFSPQARWRV